MLFFFTLLHEILNVNVEIMRDWRLEPSFIYLAITDSSEALWVNWEKNYRNWIHWPEVNKALLSLNTALLAVLLCLSVSAMMSGLKEPDFSAHVLNLVTGCVYIEDHVFLTVIKSVCTKTRHSSCSKCFILSALLGRFIAGAQLLENE